MKILVAVKRVPDFKTTIRLKADASQIETTNVKMSMNPFDEIALEEALRLKEKGVATEIVAVTLGACACQEVLRTALAMGADRAILVETQTEVQPLTAAKLLKALVLKEKPSLVLLGKQAIDTDNNQTGQMLAGLLKWAQGTFISQVQVEGGSLSVTREIDGGLETLTLRLPAVLTSDLRLNEPRYISLPNIMQAKRKPLEVLAVESLAVAVTPSLTLLKLVMPEKRRTTIRVHSAEELVKRLKEEAKVL